MFTCIIPTIEKSDKWEKQIPFLVEHDKIDEIIIIKDLPKPEISAYYEFDKIKLFYTGGGYFCNGSWNKGVELAKDAENIILANDDIVFDPNIINRMADINLEVFGIFGLSCDGIFKEVISRPFGFGQLMFMKKNHYTPIPEGIKHWYGDDWLFYQMSLKGKPNYALDCRLFEKEESASSGSEIVLEQIKKDTEWWELNNEPFKQFFWK
jgi:hypothetical protein